MIDFAFITQTIASTARRVLTASISGAGDAGDSGSSERVDGCEVVQPLGLYARPVISSLTEAIIARLADKPVILAIMDKGRSAQAVEEGEVRLYGPGSSNAAAVIRIRANGAIEITSLNNTDITVTAGGTGEVRVNGSSAKIAAENDIANLGTWTHIPASGAGVTPCSLAYVHPSGGGGPITTNTAVTGRVDVPSARRAKTSA